MSKRALHWLFWLLVAAAVAKGAYHLLSQAWFFYGGAFSGDTKYYWAMGQGYLNGLELYTDIFDTKPPAIYLLGALSYWLLGDGSQ